MRFTVAIRANPKYTSGACDRFHVVLDHETPRSGTEGFQVLRVHTSYPGAEALTKSYAKKLNEEHDAQVQ